MSNIWLQIKYNITLAFLVSLSESEEEQREPHSPSDSELVSGGDAGAGGAASAVFRGKYLQCFIYYVYLHIYKYIDIFIKLPIHIQLLHPKVAWKG